MARDRKRAKQRQRRRASERVGQNSAAGGSPDPGESRRDPDAPPPPLEDGSAEVDIARASMLDPPEGRLSEDELPQRDERHDVDEPEDADEPLPPEPPDRDDEVDEPEPLEPLDRDEDTDGREPLEPPPAEGGGGGDRQPPETSAGFPSGAGDYADPQRAREEATGERTSGAALPPEGNRFANFIRACAAELRRVQWPDRRQVGQATGVVLGFVVLAGAYLGVLDALWSRVINLIL